MHTPLFAALILACASRTAPAPAPAAVDPGFEPAVSVSPTGPHTIVRTVVEDARGDLWLGTFQGLFRYDGQVFTSLTEQSGLAAARVFALLPEGEAMWVGTMGAGVYRHEGGRWEQLTAADGLAGDRVLALMRDDRGRLWIGHEGAGVSVVDGDAVTTLGAADGFTDGDVSSIAQDGTGRIWLGSRDGLFHYDGTSFVNFSEAHGLKTGGYVPTLVDAGGELWFGGANGLHHTDGAALHRVMADESWALLEEDAEGAIWFTGDGHLNRIRPGAEAPEAVAAIEGLYFVVFEDRQGSVWTGSLEGLGRLEGDHVELL